MGTWYRWDWGRNNDDQQHQDNIDTPTIIDPDGPEPTPHTFRDPPVG
jgi:hypothetical protein